jgi:thiamine biosynthesis lipoprotein
LVHLGYEHSIETLRTGLAAARPAVPAAGCAGVEIDQVNGTIRLPMAVRLDAGGIGKGLAADLVSDELVHAGAHGAMVSLGGDLRVRGQGPHADGWTVGIEHPLRRTQSLATVQLVDGAVATSSRLGRRWRRMDGLAHHLVDARTGRQTVGVTAVSVIAATGAWADSLTKACCADPVGATTDGWLGNATAIIVDDEGTVRTLGASLAGLQLAA